MNAPHIIVNPIKAVIFDMDGLLLDTEGIYTEVIQIIAQRYGRTYDWSIKQHIIGCGAQDLAKYIVKALDLPITPDEFLVIREPLMSERFSNTVSMPGAEELVRHLKAHNILIAVGTSSSRNLFNHKTALHREWFGLFDTIVAADDQEISAAKPAPDIFLAAAHRLSVAPEDCLVFEDSPFGVTAAKVAKMTAIAIPDEAMANSKYKHADQIIRKLADFDLAAYGLPPIC
ncbi:HAD-IA family hydrolase [Candidatus Pseudomonas adelgestsugas]|uniref:Phosphorylated carbohydrates phosphatase n=1 Tax=Candidatus Pseudomonas adelgestsugas TaxID=1302376 RepID=A0ABX5RAB6_9PSED|nr:HAD-IA family hydrolase [Candidatus Pseudomonas adelgestsugas]QAX82173.1 Phosphorylated carbohydrates phosphatase [Candidatus Pseudomonas adelgestsugas]